VTKILSDIVLSDKVVKPAQQTPESEKVKGLGSSIYVEDKLHCVGDYFVFLVNSQAEDISYILE